MSRAKICLAVLSVVVAQSALAAGVLPESKTKFICDGQLAAKIRNFVLRPQWFPEPAEFAEDLRFKSPTDAVGVWLEIRQTADVVFLSRNTSLSRDVQRFSSANCKGESWSKKFPAEARDNSFDDQSLKRTLSESQATGTSGIIYIWSPHMLYSPLGLHEIQSYGKKRGLKVIGLVDPSANEAFAKKVAADYGLTSADLLRADSYELKERGFRLHYPSMILFKNGKLVSMAVPGYNASEKLQRILSKYL